MSWIPDDYEIDVSLKRLCDPFIAMYAFLYNWSYVIYMPGYLWCFENWAWQTSWKALQPLSGYSIFKRIQLANLMVRDKNIDTIATGQGVLGMKVLGLVDKNDKLLYTITSCKCCWLLGITDMKEKTSKKDE